MGVDGLVSVSRDAPVRSTTSTNWIVLRHTKGHASASEMTDRAHAKAWPTSGWPATEFVQEELLRHLHRWKGAREASGEERAGVVVADVV